MTGPARYPLAHRDGIDALLNLLHAGDCWRTLTRPQRELLLSTAADAPVLAAPRVRRRLVEFGLVTHPMHGQIPRLTDAGRWLVQWRPR